MNTKEAEKIAVDLIGKHCPAYRFQWIPAVRTFGICNYGRRIIGLSKILTEMNSVEVVTDTYYTR